MNKNINLKVTIEFYCNDMVDEETFKTEFESNPFKVYESITNGFNDDIGNFSEKSKIVKVEICNNEDVN